MNVKVLIERCSEADELSQSNNLPSIHPNTLKLDEITEILSNELPKAGVTRLASITGFSDLPWPVWISIRPNAKALSQSSGKSLSHLSALIGSAMEGIELSQAEEYIPATQIRLTYNEAKKHNCLDLTKSPIPTDLFSSTSPINWTPAKKLEKTGLDSNKSCLIPVNLIKLDFRKQELHPGFANTSNGLASGFKREEAISQALLECVERHSSTLASMYGIAKQVDLSRLPERCKNLITKLLELGLLVTIADCTAFEGLSVFECTLTPTNTTAKFTGGMGWGCHPNPEIALLRSILEANQARTIIISGSRDDMHKNIYLRERVRNRTETYNQIIHNSRPLSQIVFENSSTPLAIADNIDKTIDILTDNGFNKIYVVPLTSSEEPVQVVKVIVPGLEGYHSATYKPINSVNYRHGPFLMAQRLNQHSSMGAIKLNAGGLAQ